MSRQEHREHDAAWFEDHDKDIDRVAEGLRKFTVRKQNFYLKDRVLGGSYKIIYGYWEGPLKKAKARIWYYSGSEAAWRSFTGYRRNGAWMKGAEKMPGHEPGGYVFENLVCPELEDILEDFWKSEDPVESDRIFPWTNKHDNRAIRNFYRQSSRRHADITEAYSRERAYHRVVTPEIDEELVQALGKAATTLQAGYTSVYSNTMRKQVRKGIGHKLKHANNIWDDWILRCLDEDPVEEVPRHHPVLAQDYTIARYLVEGSLTMKASTSRSRTPTKPWPIRTRVLSEFGISKPTYVGSETCFSRTPR